MTTDTEPRCGVIGAGGHARVVVGALKHLGVRVDGLFASTEPAEGQWSADIPRRDDLDQAVASGLPLHLAIGDNRTRHRLAAEMVGAHWMSVVDPRALVAADTAVEEGALIAMGAMLQAGAQIGRHAIVNTGAIVEHDAIVSDFAHLAPGCRLLGNVTVGEGGLIGAGAIVLPGLTIGRWAVVGAGAVVTRSVGDGARVAGVPATPLPGSAT